MGVVNTPIQGGVKGRLQVREWKDISLVIVCHQSDIVELSILNQILQCVCAEGGESGWYMVSIIMELKCI